MKRKLLLAILLLPLVVLADGELYLPECEITGNPYCSPFAQNILICNDPCGQVWFTNETMNQCAQYACWTLVWNVDVQAYDIVYVVCPYSNCGSGGSGRDELNKGSTTSTWGTVKQLYR